MAHPLSGCVSSLQSSLALLESSIAILDTGVHDFPRLSKVLSMTRHFHLIPESSLRTAQNDLIATLAPDVAALLARTDAHLDRLARREQALAAKAALLEGRLGGRASIATVEVAGWRDGAGEDEGEGKRKEETEEDEGQRTGEMLNERETLRLKQVRAKKERLAYAVERLMLQAQQRQRQLRMSVAAQ